MKRIWPEHFRRDGQAKRPLAQHEAQEEAARRPNMHSYRCKFCGHWHLACDRQKVAA